MGISTMLRGTIEEKLNCARWAACAARPPADDAPRSALQSPSSCLRGIAALGAPPALPPHPLQSPRLLRTSPAPTATPTPAKCLARR